LVCSQFPQGYTASGNLQEAVVNICGYDCIADDDSGADVSYTHDAANNLTSVTAVPFVYGTDGPSTTLFAATAYNAIGQATGAGLDVVSGVVGMTMSRSYDSRERITAETDLGVSGGNIYSYSLAGGYAANGNVTGFTDSVMGSWAYGYGHKNQLISGSASAGPYSGLNLSWTYDSFGNRRTQGVSGNTSAPVPSPQTLHYNASNQIIGYTYDLDGNLTDDGTNRYQYDAENRLCAVYNYTGSGALTSYAYGPDGSRLAKGTISSFSCDFTMNGGLSPTNLYAVGPSGEQLDEVDENYDALHANVFLNGRVLATYSAEIDSNWHFSFDDWLGTRRVQQDAYQDTEGTFLSLPFGDNLTLTGNPGATENQFTSKERDQESGNDYFPTRQYSSNMGRFMSPDPSGAAFSEPSNPQSWNMYSYVQNNPLSAADPDGLDCVYINNDTGGYEGFNSGDCDNSTTANANSGYYFNGTVNTIYTTTGDTFGQVVGVQGTSDETGEQLYQVNPAGLSFGNPTPAFQQVA
jgi:RHS repeat-associated protein